MNSKVDVYLRACEVGDLKLLERDFRYLTNAAIEKIRDSRDASCLHLAARHGHLSILKYLILRKNLSPCLKSKIGASILHDAAAAGKFLVLKWLIHNTDLSLHLKDNSGSTCLHVASKFNHFEMVKWILAHDRTCAYVRSLNGFISLHSACQSGSLESVKLLIEHTPECINIQSKDSSTPLLLAIESNNLEIVECLIKTNGIDLRLRNESGKGILQVTCELGNLDILRILFESKKLIVTSRDLNELAKIATYHGHLLLLNEIKEQEARLKQPSDRKKGTLMRASTQKSPLHTASEAFQYSNTIYYPTDQIQFIKSPTTSDGNSSAVSSNGSSTYEWPAPPSTMVDQFQTTRDYQDTILFNSSNANRQQQQQKECLPMLEEPNSHVFKFRIKTADENRKLAQNSFANVRAPQWKLDLLEKQRRKSESVLVKLPESTIQEEETVDEKCNNSKVPWLNELKRKLSAKGLVQ